MVNRPDARSDAQPDARTADEVTALNAARRLGEVMQHPLAVVILAIVAATAIFGMGVSIGRTTYLATDGNGWALAAFGATVIVALVALISLGAWVDRRRRARDTDIRRIRS